MKNLIRLSVYLFFLLAVVDLFAQDDIVNWKFKTNGIVYSSPLIYNDVVYIGSLDSSFYAINAESGEKIWHFKTANKIFSTAAVSEDIICFESGNELYGLNLQGDSLWKATITQGAVTNQYDTWDYFHSSPTIVDSIAYVGSERGQVIGVNIYSGEEVFRIDTGDRGIGIRTKPVVYDSKIYFGECSGIFYCYDLNTALNVWSYDTNPEKLWYDPAILTDIAIKDGIVYFGGRHSILFALNAESGVREWKHESPTNQWILGGPAVSDSLLFMGSSNQKILHAFNIVTRKLLWTGGVDGRIFGVPAIDGDYVFVGTGSELNDNVGTLYTFNKKSGELVNKYNIGKQIHSSLKIVGDAIYFGCRNNYVYSIGKTAFINRPYSKTSFSLPGDIDVGSISNDTTLTIPIKNTGTETDSVTTRLLARGFPTGAATISPAYILLPVNDSADVFVHINPTEMDAGNKTFSIFITGHNGLINIEKNKTITFFYPGITSIGSENNMVYDFALYQNYPNPFNPSTEIKYHVPKSSNVELSVYDALGRKVETLISEQQSAGSYRVHWNASAFSTGIYYYKLQVDAASLVKRMILIK